MPTGWDKVRINLRQAEKRRCRIWLPSWQGALLAGLVGPTCGCGAAPVTPAASAPATPAPQPPATVRVAASGRYGAGRVHRFLFGGGYRDLWEAQIELPLLDLDETAGGLTPTGRFGGLQSAVLGFEGADGRRYTFRGTDKDPSAVLPEPLRDSPVRSLVQDQMAAQHPGGPLVANVVSEAAGVLTIRERMVVIPDDPRLGPYREEFAGMVGNFYVYPTPAKGGRAGAFGATEIIDGEALYARLARDPAERVDPRAFLRARLLDLLLGDFDRHRKQWRWARVPGATAWQPIPEDRDQAFVRYDGFGQRSAAIYLPILQCYGPDYPSMRGLVLHGWEQDRQLLSSLAWSDWAEVVSDLQRRVTDDVIDRAVARLPAPYRRLDGTRLRADLRGRRDAWREGARAFYDHLVEEVNVYATDAAEIVTATWTTEERLRVEIRRADPKARPHFARTFLSAETDDLRIYLRGGDDRVTVRGSPGSIDLRIVSGPGAKVIDDGRSGDAELYDVTAETTVVRGDATVVNDERYVAPVSQTGFVSNIDTPPRDWGYDVLPIPSLGYAPGVGFTFGGGVAVREFGFRKHPWSRSHEAQAVFATGTLLPTVGYSGRYRLENSNVLGEVDVEYDGNAVIRFHGFGNETSSDGDDDFFNVVHHQLTARPGVSWASTDQRLSVAGGVLAQLSATPTEDGETRLINQIQPYGFGTFFQTSVFGRVVVDLRRSDFADQPLALPLHDHRAAGYATGGVRLELMADLTPPLFSARDAWGSFDAAIAGYLGLGDQGRVTLNGRIGQRATWGNVPFFGWAYLGGGGFFSGGATNRGFIAQRFAGDAALYANADVHLYLFRANPFVPMDFGLLSFGDVGRVFVIDEPSDDWHPSGGGGIWFAPLARVNTISISAAGSEEQVQVYFRAGFHY
ncbi:MAG: hypothetical protein AAF715_07515 [Myxococcota bacterium]